MSEQVIMNQPSIQEGEITKAAKAIDPLWKIAAAVIGFGALMYSGSEAWIKIKTTETKLNAMEERLSRQYTTHKSEMDAIRKDYDEEMDVLEEEIDELKEQVLYQQAYEQAQKDYKEK